MLGAHRAGSLTEIVRCMKRLRASLLVLLAAVTAYVGVFFCWWTSGHVQVLQAPGGGNVRVVALSRAKFWDATLPAWRPAFWFLGHFCGYRYVADGVNLGGSELIFNKP